MSTATYDGDSDAACEELFRLICSDCTDEIARREQGVESILAVYPELCKDENQFGRLPLHDAVDERIPLEVIRVLVSGYPESLSVTDGGPLRCTPLHLFLSGSGIRGDDALEAIQLLASPNAVRTKNCMGELPIHTYCSHGRTLDLQVVQLLIHLHRQSVEMVDHYGLTPLHLSAFEAKVMIFQ